MKSIVFVFLLVFGFKCLWAQEFDKDQQYQQAMQNAKAAFEAKQYSQAVLFYREAQKINPESLLPKYKIEDIRTIYIEKELNKIPKQNETPKRLNKKEKKQQAQLIEKKQENARNVATEKMNLDAEKAQKELEELKIAVLEIVEDDPELSDDSIQVATIVDDREAALKVVKTKDKTILDGGVEHQAEQTLVLEKRKLVEPDPTPVDTVVLQAAKKDVVIKKTLPVGYQKPVTQKTMSDEERKIWIQNEEQKLKETYPDKKTVEEIDKPGKHITRVIMHIDNKVNVYLKVKHSWGATYFFMDEVGQELRSINEQYFNLMTNLNTYGY